MRFSDAWLDELRARVDLVELVGGYVPLKQKGRRFWGCCPFHTEKTPSFSVDSTAQMYYCFGCHKGGNAITFLMEMDRMEFADAVKELAERVNMPLPQDDGRGSRPGVSREEKEQIFAANREAALFYHRTIWQPEGAEALSYLHGRGLSDRQIRHFGLGSTAQGRDSLLRYLRDEKGFSEELLLRAGLVVNREGRKGDMFRARAMFPIIDGQGNVLGFGGRIMGSGEPKYLNTGDTPVFNKRRNLYAMNFVRKERGLKRVILAEGYMDVISLRCAGVEGVVATLGTALTEEQARLMKRMAPEVWVSYDGDGAGQKAALRALDIFGPLGVPARVLDYPDGMDPDDFIKARGLEGFEALRPKRAAQYRLERAKDGLDMSQTESREQYAIRACAILRQVENPVEREGYLKQLMIDTGFERSVLLEQIGVVAAAQTAAPAPRPARRGTRAEKPSERAKLENILLTLLGRGAIPKGTVREEDFTEGLSRDIARLLIAGVAPAAVPDRLSLEGERLDKAMRALNAPMLPEEPDKALQFAQDTLRALQKMKLDELYEKVLEQLTNASEEDKPALQRRLIEIGQEQARL